MDGIRRAPLSCTAFLCCGVFLCIAYFSGVRVNLSGSLPHRLYRIAVLPEGKALSRGELVMPDYRKIDNPAFTILCSGRDNAATFHRNAFAPQSGQDDVPSGQVLLQYRRTFPDLPPRSRCRRLENPYTSKCWPRSVFFNMIINLISR